VTAGVAAMIESAPGLVCGGVLEPAAAISGLRPVCDVIVACDATRQENDHGQLVPMVQQAHDNLGPAAQNTLTLADTGYGAGADLAAAAQHGMEVLVPPAEGAPAKDNPYATQHFHYDPRHHTVTCPQSRRLDHEGHTTKDGVRVERFRCHHRDCPVRAQCTRDPKGRQLEVRPHTAVVQAMRQRLNQPRIRAQWRGRSTIIEPRFAQIKQHDGFRRWTVRGLQGVKTQWSLLCATLNLRVLYGRWREGNPPPAAEPLGVAIPWKNESKRHVQVIVRIQQWYQRVLPSHRTVAHCRTYEVALGLVHAGFGVCLLPALTAFLVEGSLDGIDFFATDHGTRRTVAMVADQYLRIAPFKGFIEALQAAGRNIVLPPIKPWPEAVYSADEATEADASDLVG
jgi:hypothetical protein